MSTRSQVGPLPLLKRFDNGSPFWFGIIERHRFLAVQPVLDRRAAADNGALVPFADRFGQVIFGSHAPTQRPRRPSRILEPAPVLIVYNLVFVRPGAIEDTAVRA